MKGKFLRISVMCEGCGRFHRNLKIITPNTSNQYFTQREIVTSYICPKTKRNYEFSMTYTSNNKENKI